MLVMKIEIYEYMQSSRKTEGKIRHDFCVSAAQQLEEISCLIRVVQFEYKRRLIEFLNYFEKVQVRGLARVRVVNI